MESFLMHKSMINEFEIVLYKEYEKIPKSNCSLWTESLKGLTIWEVKCILLFNCEN